MIERLIRAGEKLCSEVALNEWVRRFDLDCDLRAEFQVAAMIGGLILITMVLLSVVLWRKWRKARAQQRLSAERLRVVRLRQVGGRHEAAAQ
jgi:hypothetical protein